MRDLAFDGETLRDENGEQINAIWRRCVTNDVIEHWDDSQDLIEAVRARKVALIGSFAGHIVHDKQIFEVLFKPETKALLSTEENDFIERTVPRTTFLDSTQIDLDHVRSEKDAWIIKPSDHYGADQVYAGCEVDQATWETLVDRFADGAAGYPFIVQQYIKPFKTETLPPDTNIAELSDDEVRVEPMFYNNLNGLYLYDGVFQGVFSRLGPPAYHFEGEPGDDRRDHLSTPTCTTESSSHEQERPSERDDGAHRPRSSPHVHRKAGSPFAQASRDHRGAFARDEHRGAFAVHARSARRSGPRHPRLHRRGNRTR